MRPLYQTELASTYKGVRSALVALKDRLRDVQASDDSIATVELALAEALNNVVEHAYAERDDGWIALRVDQTAQGLFCEIQDQGKPMPDGKAPVGRLGDLGNSLEEMPEGGFGWFLIRELARDLQYARIEGRNHLSFDIDVPI